MSRSYKKNSIIKDTGNYKQFCKRQANKRVRRTLDISDGNGYRKVYPQWDICDYRWYEFTDMTCKRK